MGSHSICECQSHYQEVNLIDYRAVGICLRDNDSLKVRGNKSLKKKKGRGIHLLSCLNG